MGFEQIVRYGALGLVLAAGPGHAGQCGYEYCWGALSLGDFGAAGRASRQRSAPEAARLALQNCGSRCDGFEVFVNSCAAFAEDSGQLRSFGWDADRAKAVERALASCRLTGKGCKIRVWACSK